MTEHKDKILSDIGALTHQMKVNGLFQRAAQLYQQGHMEEAENLARQVLEEQPDHADGNHLLGHIATQQGQYSRACRLLANAISINPGQSSYYLHYGIALHKDGNNEDALAALRKASEIKPDFPEPIPWTVQIHFRSRE